MKQSLATARLPDYRLDPPDYGPDRDADAEYYASSMTWADIGEFCLSPGDTLYPLVLVLDQIEDILDSAIHHGATLSAHSLLAEARIDAAISVFKLIRRKK